MTYRYRQVIEEGGGLTYLRQEFDLSPSQLFVLDNLIKHDHPERGCFPTQKRIANETGLALRTVKAALKGLADKSLIEREKLPYTDTRGRERPGKIHHYRFADNIFHACSLAWERFKNERKEALTEAMIEELETAPGRCGNCINREKKVAPDRCNNGTHVGADSAPVDRCRNGTRIGAETAPEKLEVEIEELRKGKRDSRSAAAGAAMQTPPPALVASRNEEPESPGAGLYQQAKAAEREERQAAAALAHKTDPVPEKKLCQCGAEIPSEKAASRDECPNCYFERLQRATEKRKAEADERLRLGFLEMRNKG